MTAEVKNYNELVYDQPAGMANPLTVVGINFLNFRPDLVIRSYSFFLNPKLEVEIFLKRVRRTYEPNIYLQRSIR